MRAVLGWLVLVATLAAGCGEKAARPPAVKLRLATTTSTDNSGLLQVLLPPFEERCNVKVEVIATGTGKALALGRNGDVDVLMVHAPAAELKFVEEGFGVNRRPFMHNDFIILGPREDPAGVKGLKEAAAAFRTIAQKEVAFVSRGDDSGTHRKEMALWALAGAKPSGRWYLAVGQGMGATLTIADEKRAYTLSDRGTYLAMREKIKLEVLGEGDAALHNPYAIMAVNPARWPSVKYREALMLIAWVTSPEGQQIIGGFKKHGQRLFYPDLMPSAK